jgi:hypothetical protein
MSALVKGIQATTRAVVIHRRSPVAPWNGATPEAGLRAEGAIHKGFDRANPQHVVAKAATQP